MDQKKQSKTVIITLLVLIIIIMFLDSNIKKKNNENNGKKPNTSMSEDSEDAKQENHAKDNLSGDMENKDNIEDIDEKSSTKLEEIKGIDPDKSYESHFDFPYDDIPYTDDEVFEIIKDSYDKVNFFGEFKKGNMEIYNYYKKKYYKLLSNKAPFTYNDKAFFSHPITREELYINEFVRLDINTIDDLKEYKYYFFDMDEDGAPELCIVNSVNRVEIFKYIKKTDKFILWYEIPISYLQLSGSKKIRWIGDGLNQLFYNLDENGVEESSIFFYCKANNEKNNSNFDWIYMAGIPCYKNKEETIKIKDDKKNKVISLRINKCIYID